MWRRTRISRLLPRPKNPRKPSTHNRFLPIILSATWPDLFVVTPGIVDATHIVAGSQIYLPATVSSPLRTAAKITVRKGDTLSKIAQTQLGHAAYWSCIAHANPAVHDANLIYEGQSLLLPASCKP